MPCTGCRSTLKSARAWRHNDAGQAGQDLLVWLSWARKDRLEPLKKLAVTLKEKFQAVGRGMLDHRSNAIVEKLNGAWQVQLLAVPYDHAAAAKLALQNGRPDWAVALMHGRMSAEPPPV